MLVVDFFEVGQIGLSEGVDGCKLTPCIIVGLAGWSSETVVAFNVCSAAHRLPWRPGPQKYEESRPLIGLKPLCCLFFFFFFWGGGG